MACCLTAPSHYMSQHWLIISRVLCHSPKSNSTRNAHESNHHNVFENCTFNIKDTSPGNNELIRPEQIWKISEAIIWKFTSPIVKILPLVYQKQTSTKKATAHCLNQWWRPDLHMKPPACVHLVVWQLDCLFGSPPLLNSLCKSVKSSMQKC